MTKLAHPPTNAALAVEEVCGYRSYHSLLGRRLVFGWRCRRDRRIEEKSCLKPLLIVCQLLWWINDSTAKKLQSEGSAGFVSKDEVRTATPLITDFPIIKEQKECRLDPDNIFHLGRKGEGKKTGWVVVDVLERHGTPFCCRA